MKVKGSEIFTASKSIEALSNLKLPIKKSYKIARFVKKLLPEIETITEVKNKIVLEHGTPREKNNPNSIYDLNEEGRNKLKELLDQEVVLENIEPLSEEDIISDTSETLTVFDIMALEPFINFKD